MPGRSLVRPLASGRRVRRMLVAVFGCSHGELDAVYETIREYESREKRRVSLALCCGDFQAVRNEDDLQCMACPPKYRKMNTYYKYYSGKKQIPVPTIFIGGNHEASNHLQEFPLGGLVAPNVYYMGIAGVVSFRGVRIGGLSGTYVPHDYDRPRTEYPPYPRSQLKSVYHVRRESVDDLMMLRRPLDIFLSHDWPQHITRFGDLNSLLKIKPFLKTDISSGRVGNPGTMQLLKHLKPKYWFSAHMHVKFPALVPHGDPRRVTRFLALDKPIPGRDFCQIIDLAKEIPHLEERGQADEAMFQVDPEWLAILRRKAQGAKSGHVSDEEISATEQLFAAEKIPLAVRGKSDFRMTVKPYDGGDMRKGVIPTDLVIDSRNLKIMELLGIKSSVPETPGNEARSDGKDNGEASKVGKKVSEGPSSAQGGNLDADLRSKRRRLDSLSTS